MTVRPNLQYGWRPAAPEEDGDVPPEIQHCVLPGVDVETVNHHAVGRAWCANKVFLCDGPNPNRRWNVWAHCIHCLPGADRYNVVAALATEQPRALSAERLETLITAQDAGQLLRQLVLDGFLTGTRASGTLMYRATPTTLAVWGR